MKFLSTQTFQCGITVQGSTTLGSTVYLTGLTNASTWDWIPVGSNTGNQLYYRTYAQIISDITAGIGLSGYVPTSRTLTINGTTYDLTANRSWTISASSVPKVQHQVKAGVAINKGQAVYVTSADGTNMIVGLASNASEATSSKTMGLLDATVSTNGFANVVTEGLLAGLDTSTAGTEGDPVWLGTGGNLIYGLLNKPYAPAHLVFIGIVTRKNASNGEIFVKVQNGFELNEIHDVDLKTNLPVNGELLGFNGTLWVNKTIAGWLGYTPANASGTTNYISKFTGSTTLGNSLIYDDGTNVGIGTTSPSDKLTVAVANVEGIRVQSSNSGFVEVGKVGGARWRWTNEYNAANIFELLVNNLAGSTPGQNVLTVNGSNGYVGIGTIIPNEKLHVAGNVHAYAAGGIDSGLFASTSAGSTTIAIRSNGVTHFNGGNIGIGTSSPKAKFQVNNGHIAVYHNVSTDGAQIYLGDTNFDNSGYWNSAPGIGSVFSPGTTVAGDLAFYVYTGVSNSRTERMRITDAGNVGIGTTSPAQPLHVYTTGATPILLERSTSNANVSAQFKDQTSSWYIGKASNGYFAIGEQANLGAVTIFNITDGGNVGIGTNSPSYKLHVVGEIYASSNLFGNVVYTNTVRDQAGGIVTIQDDGGSVGIGLTNPFSTLHVRTGGNEGTIAIGHATYPGLIYSNAGTGEFRIDNRSSSGAGYITFFPNGQNTTLGTEAMRITTNGNVGIGTTSPLKRLHVAQDLTYSASQSGQLYIGGATDTNKRLMLGYDTTNNFAFIEGVNFGTAYSNVCINPTFGNVGIGTTSPSQLLHIAGNIRVTGAFYDSNNQAGTSGQILKSTGSGTDWVSLSEITGVDGTGTANYVTKWSDADTITNSLIYDNGTNVGIGTTSPGYNFDVNGQVRVQDKLRVGTVNSGNGVVHMSSTATINPSATTIVWAQNVSVGMCAFIEYYILNNNSLTDQRAGTIMVTWNQSGTPTIAHTETTTPDIGSTIAVNFTSSLVGSDARINAVNSSANPYTIVMSYKYF